VGNRVPLPRPESGGMEIRLMGLLCVATIVAVLQFFAGLARFSERAPDLAARVNGLNPALVQRVLAGMGTNRALPGPRMAGPAEHPGGDRASATPAG